MIYKRILPLVAIFVFVGALPALASVSLEPLDSEENESWLSKEQVNGVWWFEIVKPPNSNDMFALQAVTGEVFVESQLVKDDYPDLEEGKMGSTSPWVDGIDNDDGTITWTSSWLSPYVIFKAAGSWYTVWNTVGAVFDEDKGVWTETITWGKPYPHGNMSHTTILIGEHVIPEPTTIAVWTGLACLGLLALLRQRSRRA